jgi:PAS domain S-box-containing protein
MTESDKLIHQRLTSLKDEYRSQLDSRIREIRGLWNGVRTGISDLETLDELHAILNNLVISGTPFGIEQIAEAAQLLEIFVSSLRGNGGQLTDIHKRQIDLLLQLLDTAISSKHGLGRINRKLRWEPADISPEIIEDEPEALILLKNALNISELSGHMRDCGYNVEVFSNYHLFIEAVHRKIPNLIIISATLSGEERDELYSLHKLLDRNNKKIPVICISNRDDLANRLISIRHGYDAYFTLPLDVQKFMEKVEGLTSGIPRDPYRILIIDDDRVMTDFYRFILENEGMNVSIVNNPLASLEAIRRNRPELILLNVYMPGCSGLELVKIIRQFEEFVGISIVYLSSNTDFELRISAIDAGGDDLLKFPLDPDHLIATINSRVTRARTLNTMSYNFKSALREIENQNFALDQHAIVSITNVNGTIVYINDKFCDISGYTRSELLGKDHNLLKSGVHPESLYADMWNSINQGKVWQGEVCNRKKNGKHYWVDMTIVPFMDEKNRPYHYVAINTDISSRIFAENDLLNARDIAISANQAKSEFLSKMSHELRTPLNVMMGFSQLLELSNEFKPDDTQLQYLNEIQNAGNHLLELLSEVLDLSRIEANQLNIEKINIPLEAFLDECCSLVMPMTQKMDVSIARKYHDSKLIAFADPLRLKQILLNLLSNAIKYNRQSGSVTIKAASVNNRITIDVIDTGEGIPHEQINKLFQPFYRLPHHRQEEGVGIGLTLSKRLVELMGGSIGVESQFGNGTRFWIEISGADPDEVYKTSRRKVVAKKLISRELACNIIYIEDNLKNYNLIKEALLQRPHYRLTHAPSAEVGLEMAETARPDIILMDLQLPGLNGYDAFKKIKESPLLCHIPVIAISADLNPVSIERAMQLGFHEYFTKPIDILSFFATLDTIADRLT